MKKVLNVKGLDCANCAKTLEKYIETVEGVNSCDLNFATSKVYLNIDDDKSNKVIKDIYKLAKQVNPDVRLSEEKINNEKVNVCELVLYAMGFVLGLVVLLVKMNVYMYYSLIVLSGLLMGYKTYWKAILQLKKFKINENTLVTISIFGAIAIGECMEGLMVIALYSLGKYLESKAVNYSRKSISKLISSQPEYAVIFNNKKEEIKVAPDKVNIGDIIIVKPGEKVALDGVVVEGNASVDKKHLTGESLPVLVNKDCQIEAGSIVLDSEIKIKVLKEYKDSTVSKILNLVEDATNKKSKTETFISKFASIYTMVIIISAIITCGITYLVLNNWSEAIYRGLIFLVVSCPCAFAISVPLGYFSGIGKCSNLGILVKGSNYLDICANLKNVVFDKTGTLTTGKFSVEKIEIVDKEIAQKELLEIVVAGEQKSRHPVAVAICEYCNKKSKIKITDFKENIGIGVEFSYNGDRYNIGRINQAKDNTCVEIVKNTKVIAYIYLSDSVKSNAEVLMNRLKGCGIKTYMLTGDNKQIASNIAGLVGVDKFEAELYPKDKYEMLDKIKQSGCTAFVGDGLNDSPSLALADVGISMGMLGSDATIESSDVVIADDNISKVYSLINISKKTKRIILQNIIFAGITKLLCLILGAVGLAGMLIAVFADVGVTLIAILNSLRVLKTKDKNNKR